MANAGSGVDYGNLAQWIAAISTFLAVLIALFKEEIIRIFRRPNLRVSVKLGPPDCHKTQVSYVAQGIAPISGIADCYYLRLWVENKGTIRAEKVQVFAARLWRRLADGSFKQVEEFLPMNLRWTHSGSRIQPEIFADGISPKMGRHCDLGHIVDPKVRQTLGESLPGVGNDKTVLALELEVQPNTLSHLLAPGVYRLELLVAAANRAPIPNTIEINLTGEWHDKEEKMFSDGVGVKLVS